MAIEKSAVAVPVKSITVFAVRTLKQIAVDHFELTGGRGQQSEFAAGHRHHILHRFQPGVIPDRGDIAVRVRQRPLAGRIDQSALVDVGEIAGNALAEVSSRASGWARPPGGCFAAGLFCIFECNQPNKSAAPDQGFVRMLDRRGRNDRLPFSLRGVFRARPRLAASLRRGGVSGKFDERDHRVLGIFQKFRIAAQLLDGAWRLEAGRTVRIDPVFSRKLPARQRPPPGLRRRCHRR